MAGQRSFLTLDALRGVAAIAVVTLHASVLFGGTPFASAYLAVDLFFLLSGLVLAHAYEPRFADGMGVRQFMVIRCIRLLPLFLLGAALAAIVLVAAKATGNTDLSVQTIALGVAFNTLMLPSPTWQQKSVLFVANTPAWSLFFEIIVNLAYVTAFRWLTDRAVAGIVLVSAMALLWLTLQTGHGDLGSNWPTFIGGFPRVAFSFFLGVLIARRAARDTPTPSVIPWLLIAVVAGILALDPGITWRPVFDLVCVMLVLPALVLVAIRYNPATGAAVFSFLGASSYALYILHYPVMELIRGSLKRIVGLDMTAWTPWLGITFVAAMMLIAALAERFYERPCRRALALWRDRRS